MASENLINELFEIVQANSNEKIYYSDFEDDLLKSINLQNDEIDRALALMLSQAEVNPNLIGETKGGTFVVSQSFAKSIVSTIEYEKLLVERSNASINDLVVDASIGVMLLEKADQLIDNVIISNDVAEKMIDNYGNLSGSEVASLWDSYDNLDEKNRAALREAKEKDIKAIIEDPNATPEEKSKAEEDLKVADRIEDEERAAKKRILDPLRRKKYRQMITLYREKNPEVFSAVFPNVDKIDELSDEMLIMIKSALNRVEEKQSAVDYRQRVLKKSEIEKLTNPDGLDVYGQQVPKESDEGRGAKSFLEGMPPAFKSMVIPQRDGKANVVIPGTVQDAWSGNYRRNMLDTSYVENEEDFAYIIAAFDGIYQKINLSEEDKITVMEVLRDVIRDIPEQDLKRKTIHIRNVVEQFINAKIGDKIPSESIMQMLDMFDSIIPAIKDNRDAVVEKALDPYIEGKLEGKSVTQIMLESFKTLLHEKAHDIQGEYLDFMSNFDKASYINPSVQPKSYTAGKKEISEVDEVREFVQGNENYTQIPYETRLITDKEYSNAAKKEEELRIDEDGLRKASAELLEKAGSSPDTATGQGYNYENQLIGFNPEMMGLKSRPSRRKQPKKEVKAEQGDEEKSVGDESTSGKNVVTSGRDEERRGTVIDAKPLLFFDPIKEGYKNVREVRSSDIREQTEALREAAKVSEKSLQELIAQEMEEEPTQGE